MDYDGLMIKYKNRASSVLVADELNHQLCQHQEIDLNGRGVMDDAAVIHFSSGYMEIVDKWYSIKGFLTVPALSLFLLWSWSVLSFSSKMIFEYISGGQRDFFYWGFGNGVVIVSFLLAWLCSKFLRVECFRWTHYPVRFDRKNRLVHVFSVDGEVYSAPWDKIFFTTGDCVEYKYEKRKYHDIRGHVLAEDGKTVLKTFTLPVSAARREELYPNWEFVRRYMEEGPEAVADVLQLMPPVEGRREGIGFGYWYLMFSASYGAPLPVVPFLMVLYLTAWPFRVFAMYSCKIPRWSKEVDAQCEIAADDPWDISAAQNPRSIWRWMLWMDKSHSMVSKKRAMMETP
ncbi:Uncharacterised protein [Serratia rubidaea]|nr:Uncharacterised protein [Serratia rubidaea]